MKKKCSKCKEDKELNKSNFHRRAKSPDGYAPECKACNYNFDSKRNWKSKNDWQKMWIG